MKVLAILLNVFFPGVGTIVAGRVALGIFQIIAYGIGVILTFTGIGAIIGIPIMFVIWIWGIVIAAKMPDAPVATVITRNDDQYRG